MPDSGDRQEEQSDLDASDLNAVRMAMEGLQGSGWQPPAQTREFTPRFPDLESWVSEFFVLTFGRSGEQHWCASWWDHPEAVLRLEALWRSWEVAALDPVRGMALWIREHLDRNLDVLFGAAGPFAQCTPQRHTKTPVLPVNPPPDGWWTTSQHWWDVVGEGDR
jgi:hypothetical protein